MLFECTNCTEMNEDNRRFCFKCGELLGCPKCGFINDYIVETELQHDFFCGGCGSTLSFDNNVVDENAEYENEMYGVEISPQIQAAVQQDGLPLNRVLGFDLNEITADVASESTVTETVSLGGPKHLQQDDLDELFDV